MAFGNEYLEYPQKGMAAYKASHMHQPHKARQAFRDAHEGRIAPLTAYFSATPLSRILSQLGADIMILDWEHAAMGVESMTTWVHEIQYMSEGRTLPFVRLPNHDHSSIAWALDAGAHIMVPQVNNVEQAKKIVAATKFGKAYKNARSVPPMRLMPGVADSPEDPSQSVWANQNRQAAVVIQMESVEGAENLDAILAACGKEIDAVFIGALDMRIDMGLEGAWGDDKEFTDVLQRLRDTCRKHDVPFASPVLGKNWDRAEGRVFGVCGLDVYTLWGDREVIAEAKAEFTRVQKASLASKPTVSKASSNVAVSEVTTDLANGVH